VPPTTETSVRQTAYRYRAARGDGSIEQGTVHAASVEDASTLLARQDRWVLDIHPQAVSLTSAWRAMSTADLALGLRLLASLLEAGLPVARALAALGDVAPDAWRPALPAIRDAVERGEPLGQALSASPVGLPPSVIGMVRAGEAGSGLAPAVRRAATFMEAAAATRAAIRSALAYPVILSAAGLASVALLVTVVLPRFATILGDLGQALPPTTLAVLTAAQVARRAALPGLVAAVWGALVWRTWATSQSGRPRWHAFLLSVPGIGAVRRAAATARYARALSALLESGVPISAALRSAAEATGDAELACRLLRARDRVVHGSSVSAAVAAEDAATPTVQRLMHAGEATGQLAELLAHAASIEQERAERTVKAAVRLLEPALILAFGGLVAFVAAALLQAIYSVRPGA